MTMTYIAHNKCKIQNQCFCKRKKQINEDHFIREGKIETLKLTGGCGLI